MGHDEFQPFIIEALEELRDELRNWAFKIGDAASDDIERGRAIGVADAALILHDEIKSRRKQAVKS
jgi:hypothetical protein